MSTTYRVWLTVHAREDEVEVLKDALTEEAPFKYNVTLKLLPREGVLLDAEGDVIRGNGPRTVEHMAYELRCAVWCATQRRVRVDVQYAVMEPDNSAPEGEGDFDRAVREGHVLQTCRNCQQDLPFGSQERVCAACETGKGT